MQSKQVIAMGAHPLPAQNGSSHTTIARRGEHERIQHPSTPAAPEPVWGVGGTTDRDGRSAARLVCRAGSDAWCVDGTSVNAPRTEAPGRRVPDAYGLDCRASEARADREIPDSSATMDGSIAGLREPANSTLRARTTCDSRLLEVVSPMAHLLGGGLRSQVGPDQVEVVWAQIAAGDGAFCGAFNGDAVRWPRTTVRIAVLPLADLGIAGHSRALPQLADGECARAR